jgi:hypothetical protein
MLRLALAPLCPRRSSLPTSTFTEPSMLSMTLVRSTLSAFSDSIVGSCSTLLITMDHCVALSYICVSWRFQSIDPTLLLLTSGWRFSKARDYLKRRTSSQSRHFKVKCIESRIRPSLESGAQSLCDFQTLATNNFLQTSHGRHDICSVDIRPVLQS